MAISENITIIGGGNGGFAAAADLTIRGHKVLLYEHPNFKDTISDVKEIGGIDLETLPSSGLTGGFAKLHDVTSDIEMAMKHAELVFVIAPAFAFESIAKECAPFVSENQIFVLCPGNFGGSIFFKNELIKNGCSKNIWIAELECLMYACRKKDSKSVWIRGYKHNLGCGIFPEQNSLQVMKRLQAIYPTLIRRGNVLEVGMCNPNMIVHTSTMVLSTSCIDNKEERLFYVQCLSKSVGKLIDEMDQERMQINNVPGFQIPSLMNVISNWYSYQGATGNSVSEIFSHNPIFKWSKMPTSLLDRYITEDIPFGLIPMELFLKQFGMNHDNISSLIKICCTITGVDLYKQARTPEKLGIDHMTSEQLLQYLYTGEK